MEISSWGNIEWCEDERVYSYVINADGIDIPCTMTYEAVINNLEMKDDDPVWLGKMNFMHIIGKAALKARAGELSSDGSIHITDDDFTASRQIAIKNAIEHKQFDIAFACEWPSNLPEPESLFASHAAAWYRNMVQLIPLLCSDLPHEQAIESGWKWKRAFRKIAAQSLLDQQFVAEFYLRFPILELNYIRSPEHLTQLSDEERAVYPSHVGGSTPELIGLTWQKAPNTIYILTARGWRDKSSWRHFFRL